MSISNEPTDIEKALWKILDDIDTATDRFRPINGEESMQLWYRYIQKNIKRRFDFLASHDGVTLKYQDRFHG